jgi:hypothetical protein
MDHLLLSALLSSSGLVLSSLVLALKRRRRSRDILVEVCRELKLKSTSSGGVSQLEGTIEGFGIEVASSTRTFILQREDVTSVSIRGNDRIPKGLTLISTESWRALGNLLSGERVLTFDPSFDVRVVAQGPELETIALLSEQARRMASHLVGVLGANVCLGRLYVEMTTPLEEGGGAQRLLSAVRSMIELAGALSTSGMTNAERLLSNVRFDGHWAVRHRSLSLLLEHQPGAPEAMQAVDVALEDASAWLRLLAAQSRGDGGLEHLERIIRDETSAEAARVAAIEHIAKLSTRGRVIEVLEWVLDNAPPRAQAAAVESMVRMRHHPLDKKTRLEMLLASKSEPAIRAVLKMIDLFDDRRFEPALIDLLGGDAQLADLSIDVLARLGTVEAVPALFELSRQLLLDPHLKRSAREAVASIQARIGDVDPGALAIAEGEREGQLSVTGEAGDVSVVDG